MNSEFKAILLSSLLSLNLTSIYAGTEDSCLEVDVAGNSVAVWQYNGCTGSSVSSAFLLANEVAWSKQKKLSSENECARDPCFVMNSVGDGVVVWNSISPSTSNCYISASILNKGSWSDAIIISESNENVLSYTPRINELSKISVIWNCYPSLESTDTEIHSSSADATIGNSSWTSPIKVSN